MYYNTIFITQKANMLMDINQDRPETLKYLQDLNANTQFKVLDTNYLEQLRASLNYSPRCGGLANTASPSIAVPTNGAKINLKDYNNNLIMENVDYLILTYSWSDEAGRDLDTRTQIVEPLRIATVGWNKLTNDEDYLTFSGDNTASGEETVLVNVTNLAKLNATDNTIKIELRAFWFGNIGTKIITLKCVAYKGGTINKTGYTFMNTGGELLNSFQADVSVEVSKTFAEGEGEKLMQLTINTQTKQVILSSLKE